MHDTVEHIVQGVCKAAVNIRRGAGGEKHGVTPQDIHAFLAVTWPELMQPDFPGSEVTRPTLALPSADTIEVGRAYRAVQRERYVQAAAAATASLAGGVRSVGGAKRPAVEGGAAAGGAAAVQSPAGTGGGKARRAGEGDT